MFLSRLLMADELPTGDKAIFAFLEMFALAFAFEGAGAFLHGEASWRIAGAWTISAFFFVAGIKWPWIKDRIGLRLAAGLSRIANDSRYRIGAMLLVAAYISGYLLISLYELRSDFNAYIAPRTVTENRQRICGIS
jgi:hypothetical protein